MRSRNLYLVPYDRSSKKSVKCHIWQPPGKKKVSFFINGHLRTNILRLFINVFFSPLYFFHILSKISPLVSLFPCKIIFFKIKHPKQIIKKSEIAIFYKIFVSFHPLNSILDQNRQYEWRVAVMITFVSILAKTRFKSDKKWVWDHCCSGVNFSFFNIVRKRASKIFVCCHKD